MKPGWQTTEFWLNVAQQAIALLVLFGVIAPQQAATVQEAVAKDILAVAVLAASLGAVVHYVQGRIRLKSQRPDSFRAALLLLALGGLAGPAVAAPPPPAGVTCQPVAFLGWRAQAEQRLQRLEQQAGQPPAGPQIHYHFWQGGPPQAPAPILIGTPAPQQQLPIAGQPQQQLPIAGAPQQQLPVPGAPQQQLPTPGVPQQPLPGQGTPQQQLPVAPSQPMPHLPVAPSSGPSRYTRYALYRR